ncbi:CBS domain-containing protein [Streptomyces sp. TRM66268-LWL]|uniref:CBS domain-containing protein n=1 Tax=Streptomyces polyasparticus TaxID=2767826 RepID=A0ABR7SSX6_9ACTN|nr:CBS domain-containing protein [Streptomyces polyasparticus]MBC9717398.1 CBS domain-containing protein [Streptomyces polyasparticus]
MKHSKVGSVMTGDVVHVGPDTPFKEVARLLNEHRISGLPVVDKDRKVTGVISETDLMLRQAEDPFGHERPWQRLLSTPSRRIRQAKARARTAGQLMSRPAVTVHAGDTITQAARIMTAHRVERLPVVDENDRLTGIVTRRDLLQVFSRSDEDLRREVITEVLIGALWLTPRMVDVEVEDGVVTLSGQLERSSEIPIAVRMTGQVDGVVSVVDKLTYRLDDSRLQPSEQALHGIADDWLRKL